MDSDEQARALIGTTVADRYRVLDVLGAGGMGTVYLAEHVFTKRRVALKRMHPQLGRSKQAAERFIRESQAPSTIGHPGIVQVLDGGSQADGSLYIVHELLEGVSMSEAIARNTLTASAVIQLGVELLQALSAAHKKGIIHRDIKPDNVFIAQDGSGGVSIKLLDFGIASLRDTGEADKLTRPGSVLGTAQYMSPEQAMAAPVDERSDLWSVGTLLYHALCGRLPYPGDTFSAVIVSLASKQHVPLGLHRPDLPPALVEVVERALRKPAAERFGSAAEMAAALAAVSGDGSAESSSLGSRREHSACQPATGAGLVATSGEGAATSRGRSSAVVRSDFDVTGAVSASMSGEDAAGSRGRGATRDRSDFDARGAASVTVSGVDVAARRMPGSTSERYASVAQMWGESDAAVSSEDAAASSPAPAAPMRVGRVQAALRSQGGTSRAALDPSSLAPAESRDRSTPTSARFAVLAGTMLLCALVWIVLRDRGGDARAAVAQLSAADVASVSTGGGARSPQLTLEGAAGAADHVAAAAPHGLALSALAPVLASRQAQLERCLQDSVVSQLLAGAERVTAYRLDVSLNVAPSGQVESAEISGAAPAELVQCLRAELLTATFPRASEPTAFRYPLVLTPTVLGQ